MSCSLLPLAGLVVDGPRAGTAHSRPPAVSWKSLAVTPGYRPRIGVGRSKRGTARDAVRSSPGGQGAGDCGRRHPRPTGPGPAEPRPEASGGRPAAGRVGSGKRKAFPEVPVTRATDEVRSGSPGD